MKSKLFIRLFIGITIIILLTGLISVFLGQYAVRQYFFNMKLGELEPQIKAIAKNLSEKTLPTEIDAKSLNVEAIIKIYNKNKEQLVNFVKPEKAILKDDLSKFDNIDKPMSAFVDLVLSGDSVKEITKLENIEGEVILIGEPITNNGEIIGAFFSIKPVEEYGASLQGFYFALIISMGSALFFILAFVYFFSKKLLKPLNSIKNSSVEMANGNFSLRVDENQKDEIGELAKSINILSMILEKNEISAKQLEKTRRDYIANISHELRTPVSAIRAFTETLNDSMIKDELQKKKYYGMMLRETIRLERLISDMLNLSRLQSGNAAIQKNITDMKLLLINVISNYKLMAEDMDISFLCDINLEEIPHVYTNSDRITQVLIILLDNAMKYTLSGGIIKLSASWDKEMIKIQVIDTGEGIAVEDIPLVFERFYKADKSHSSKGTGLGLSIAKEILFHLNEDISVASNLGEGSVFTFTLHRK